MTTPGIKSTGKSWTLRASAAVWTGDRENEESVFVVTVFYGNSMSRARKVWECNHVVGCLFLIAYLPFASPRTPLSM